MTDDDGDLLDELPGGRHSKPAVQGGKGTWLAQYGLTPADLAGKIITVAAYKGGVGKTFLAYELAYMLGAIYLDLDWDDGNGTGSWGYNQDKRLKAPLLEAIQKGRVPRPLAGGPWRPDLVPCFREFVVSQPSAKEMAKLVTRWAGAWGDEQKVPVVVDTHNGGGIPSAAGAVAAGHVVVMPAVLGEKEMRATEGALLELRSHPLLLIPNMVPPSPPDRYITRLERAAEEAQVPIGPVVGEHRWLKTRSRRMAVTASQPTPKRAQVMVDELHEVGRTVVSYVRAAA